MSNSYDLVVVGGGPGGYVAAAHAGRHGLRVACVERDQIGGVCLHRGCIPSKTFIRSAELLGSFEAMEAYGVRPAGPPTFDMPTVLANKAKVVDRLHKGVKSLLKAAGVEVIAGEARLDQDANVMVVSESEAQTLETRRVIVATGSAPRGIPGLPIDGERVITSDHALDLDRVPESAIVLGAGAIGMEFAYFLSGVGSRVTVLELLPRVLPLEDEDASNEIQRLYRNRVSIRCGVRVTGAERTDAGVRVRAEDAAGAALSLEAEVLLVAVGRRPLGNGIGLEECGVEVERGFVRCDATMRTANPKVYAIGDVVGRLPLAHTASAEGRMAVNAILGHEGAALDYRMIPRGTYCIPEVASVGWTEAQAVEAGIEVATGKLMFRAIGKAVASGEFEGFAKVVAGKASGKLLGVHIVGPHATDLIAEAGLALSLGATARDVARTVHAHPTLAEILMEVCETMG